MTVTHFLIIRKQNDMFEKGFLGCSLAAGSQGGSLVFGMFETQRKHQTTQQEVSCLRLSTQEQPLALFILA